MDNTDGSTEADNEGDDPEDVKAEDNNLEDDKSNKGPGSTQLNSPNADIDRENSIAQWDDVVERDSPNVRENESSGRDDSDMESEVLGIVDSLSREKK